MIYPLDSVIHFSNNLSTQKLINTAGKETCQLLSALPARDFLTHEGDTKTQLQTVGMDTMVGKTDKKCNAHFNVN